MSQDGDHPPIEFIARGLLVHSGHVLLCRSRKQGYSYLPGGHIEPGEPAAEALARELVEEANLTVTVGGFLHAHEVRFETRKRRHHEINVVFHVEHPDARTDEPPAVESAESEIEFHWADLASLVDIDLRPGIAKAWLVDGGSGRDACPACWASSQE